MTPNHEGDPEVDSGLCCNPLHDLHNRRSSQFEHERMSLVRTDAASPGAFVALAPKAGVERNPQARSVRA